MLSCFDYLKLVDNADINTMLEKYGEGKEVVIYSRNMTKVNRRGKEQTRTLVITNKAVYNLIPNKWKKYKRRVPLREIFMVTLSSKTDEFVIHIPKQYDYYFKSDDKQNVSKSIQMARKKLLGADTVVKFSSEDTLNKMVFMKAENKEDLTFDRASELVLEPYKSYQTAKGRVISMPRRSRKKSKRKTRSSESKNDVSSFRGTTLIRDARSNSVPPQIPQDKPRLQNRSSTSIIL